MNFTTAAKDLFKGWLRKLENMQKTDQQNPAYILNNLAQAMKWPTPTVINEDSKVGKNTLYSVTLNVASFYTKSEPFSSSIKAKRLASLVLLETIYDFFGATEAEKQDLQERAKYFERELAAGPIKGGTRCPICLLSGPTDGLLTHLEEDHLRPEINQALMSSKRECPVCCQQINGKDWHQHSSQCKKVVDELRRKVSALETEKALYKF